MNPQEQLRELARRIASEEGLELVVLFGSSARTARSGPPSDVDLGVLAAGPSDLVRLTNRFSTALGRQDVDLVDLRRADPVLLLSVAREGAALYEASPDRFARFQSLAARRFADTRKFRRAEREEIRDFVARRGARTGPATS